MKATRAQLRALEAARDGEIVLDRRGCPDYDGREISGSALAACRRRRWMEVDSDISPYGRMVPTEAGWAVLASRGRSDGGWEALAREGGI